jgi:hypothetical protein
MAVRGPAFRGIGSGRHAEQSAAMSLAQLFWRRSAVAASTTVRRETRPPALRRASVPSRLKSWFAAQLDADATQGADDAPFDARLPRNTDPVLRVQRDFARELADIPTPQAGLALGAVWRARSLHDLWHLRVQVFDSVARHLDQHEAEARLVRLNRHFPTRSPRSGLAPLATAHGGLGR